MPHWAALRSADGCASSPATDAAGVAIWALQFTPRVAHLDESVVLEVEQSVRLFGGEEPLHHAIEAGAAELGMSVAWAPTSLAALACARLGVSNGFDQPLRKLLDGMPLQVLNAANAQEATLARLGCKTLADVRKLPRGGMSRRFGDQLLLAMDQAYGDRSEGYPWVELPETFAARLELPGRVETAPALMFGARRLLLQLGGWLMARRAGVTAFDFKWCHDVMRSKAAGDGGQLTIRTAAATQNVDHLCRLLSEHLAKVQLLAPAGDIAVMATEVVPIIEQSRSLIPDAREQTESLALVLERIEARLGNKRVLRPTLVEDHRLEWMHRWQPLDVKRSTAPVRRVTVPQPTWILRNPLKLSVKDDKPLFQGPLQLIVGPDRVEGGWWHRVEEGGHQLTRNVVRDYWVAMSEHAGPLWIFSQRLATTETGWYLHGHFA